MLDKLLLKDLGPYRWLIFAMMIGGLLGAWLGIYAGKSQAEQWRQQKQVATCHCVCPCAK